MSKRAHIIVFGGYFDPPHEGHLALVKTAMKSFPKAQIYVVPTFAPPQTTDEKKLPKATYEQRQMMCHLLFEELENVEVSNVEKNLSAPNYSLNTLQYFKDLYKPERLSFLMGDDQLKSFTKWHEYKKILQIADLLVAARAETNQQDKNWDDQPEFKGKVEFIHNLLSQAQSRLIRENKNEHTDWLDPKVAAYANRHLIYQ